MHSASEHTYALLLAQPHAVLTRLLQKCAGTYNFTFGAVVTRLEECLGDTGAFATHKHHLA